MEFHFRGDLWKVKMVSQIPSQTDDIDGEIDWMTMTIKIKKGLGREKTHQTLWHEILHLAEWYYRVELPHKDLDKIGMGLAELISLNRVTFKALFN